MGARSLESFFSWELAVVCAEDFRIGMDSNMTETNSVKVTRQAGPVEILQSPVCLVTAPTSTTPYTYDELGETVFI